MTDAQASPGDPDVLSTLGVGQRRGARRWATRLLVTGVVLSVVGGGVFAYRALTAKSGGPRWATAKIEQGDIRETVIATGTLSPLDSVQIGAEVTGRVTSVKVDVNDAVQKDEVLVELDTEPLDARVEEAGAQLRSAQASLGNAKATLKEAEAKAARTKELFSRGLASAQEQEAADATLDRGKASVSTAAAQISLAQASVKTAETNKSKAIIRSPIEGIVLARSVEVGQTVTSGLQTPVLFTVARDLANMQLKIDVNEADVGRAKDGQRATFVVDAYPKREFVSSVIRLGNLPKTGTTVVTYEGLLTVDNSEKVLRPGMTATATIVTSEQKGVLTVPNTALRFEPPRAGATASPSQSGLPLPGLGAPQRSFSERPRAKTIAAADRKSSKRDGVYVEEGGQLKRLPVEVGATDGRKSEVRGEGLRAGMSVVIDVLGAGE